MLQPLFPYCRRGGLREALEVSAMVRVCTDARRWRMDVGGLESKHLWNEL